MKPLKFLIYLIISSILTAFVHADVSFSTNFSGAEGYVSGPLDKSKQSANPFFKETGNTKGGLYFPVSQGPKFGVVRRNPTSGGARAICTKGEGSKYGTGSNWVSRAAFTFEGAPSGLLDGKLPAMLGGVGFTNSQEAVSKLIYAGIQKSPKQSDSYQFYVFANGGGGFFAANIAYDLIGDDLSDANDLSDRIEIELKLTKSSRDGLFEFVATLKNLDKKTTVETLTGNLKVPELYNADLFAYFSSGGLREAGNYDIFNLESFGYQATKAR